MRSESCLLIATVSVLTACADLPGESTTQSAVVTANRLTANRLTANRLTANRLRASRLATTQLGGGQLALNMQTAGKLLENDDGRELLSLIVSCAMPPDMLLVGTHDGRTFTFFGDLGLAFGWIVGPLDLVGQQWVSACVFARLNREEVILPISIRGPNPALAATPGEKALWSVEEGAFFGNFFVDISEPIQWFACRGAGQAAGEFGDLIDRDCAEPDPANPTQTLCGLTFAGDCGSFALQPSCDQFSGSGTFYAQCHVSPKVGDKVFHQVITSYVTP